MGYFILFAVLAVVILAIRETGRQVRTDNRIRENGVETWAVVTDVRSDWYEEPEPDGRYYSYLYDVVYLRYTDTDGSSCEGRIGFDGTVKYRIGSRIRIRFLPGKEDAFIVMEPSLQGKRGQIIRRIKTKKVKR